MATNQNALTNDTLENLLMTEVMRLHQDQSTLENLRDLLPARPSHSRLEAQFLSLWDDIEARADRLELLLEDMTSRRTKPPARVICIAPPFTPSAA